MPALPHVAILVETSRSYGRGLLRGIRRYIAEHGPWSVFIEQRALESKPPPWLKHWRGDGILTRTGNQRMADLIRKAGVPAVELRATRLRHDFPFVGVDNRALGRLVAEHLRERGFRHFGVYGIRSEEYFEQRCEDFVQAVGASGYPVHVCQASGNRERPAEWERHQERIARWLRDLPKPVGIMACTDQLGFWVIDASRRAGIVVPEEVAVVGVENDETLCSVSYPTMSSVQCNTEQIGYRAAALLDSMMAGKAPPAGPMLVEPLGVVVRQSSDVVAIDDAALAAAVRFIRRQACAGITVGDVLRAVPVSRSTLERGLRKLLGRSPSAEILRVRLEQARRLLAETEMTLLGIAQQAGFRHPQHLCERFKQSFGQTPGAYRDSIRDKITERNSANSE